MVRCSLPVVRPVLCPYSGPQSQRGVKPWTKRAALGLHYGLHDTPASKMRARPRAAQYPAYQGPVLSLAFEWRNRRAFTWLSVLRFELGVPNPTFLAFCRQARQPVPA